MIKYISQSKLPPGQVVLRLDLNEPLSKSGNYVADDYRIQKSLPTIQQLMKQGRTIIVLAHLGRPKAGATSGSSAQDMVDEKLSLRPIAKKLAELLEVELRETKYDLPETRRKHLLFYTGNLADELHQKNLQQLPQGSLVLCENIRFYSGEEGDSPVFGKHLASLGQVFVNDAFSVCHHGAASISAITKYLPSYAGLQLEKEIIGLDRLLNSRKSPFVVMMGGMKISEKAAVLSHLGSRADFILLGGGLANELLEAQGYKLNMKADIAAQEVCASILRNFKGKVVLPKDLVAATQDAHENPRVCKPGDVKINEFALDVGPETMLEYAKILKSAQTIVWNGPLGLYEEKSFSTSTLALAKVVGGIAGRSAYVVVGGGETVDAVRESKQEEHIDLLSTGGGAMLSYLAGEKLPGIVCLTSAS